MPVGGQAVLEGVLMKGYTRWGLAVRNEEGKIVTEHWPSRPVGGEALKKIPILRGFLNMIEMMREGFRALSRSANIALGEDDEMTWWDMTLTIALSMIMVIGLFVALPVFLSDLARSYWALSKMAGNAIEGVVRGVVFVVYLAMIGMWKDMARILGYHGAEHKTINAYESGAPVTVEHVMNCSRLHPRCGTSFLLIVVIASIIVFSLIPSGGIIWRILSRVILVPVVVGLSYEFIRAMSKMGRTGLLIMRPAMTLQYLTTREPDASQAEVGIRSLEEALDRKFSTEA